MEFRNVESLEIVIGCFDFGAFDDGETDREENVFDLLEDLPNEVVRAERTDDSGKRKVDAFTGAGGFLRACLNALASLFDFGLDVGAKLIEFLADAALEFRSGGLDAVIGDLNEDAGLGAQPGMAKLVPSIFVVSALARFVPMSKSMG